MGNNDEITDAKLVGTDLLSPSMKLLITKALQIRKIVL